MSLSLAIINFLKHVSKDPETQKQLKNKTEELKQILFAEQEFTYDYSFIATPVEIEAT